jgi:hypothetical protein
MAAPRPARLVKTTVAVYVAALFATAPFTGGGSTEPSPAAAADPWTGIHMTHVPAGVQADVISFAVPVSAYELAAALPSGARVLSLVGPTPDGGTAGVTVPDGLPLAGALAALGPDVAATPVASIAIAHDDAAREAIRAAFAGRLAPGA